MGDFRRFGYDHDAEAGEKSPRETRVLSNQGRPRGWCKGRFDLVLAHVVTGERGKSGISRTRRIEILVTCVLLSSAQMAQEV